MIEKRKPKKTFIVFSVLFFLILIGVGTFFYMLSPIDYNNKENIEVVIKSGTSSSRIASILKDKGLIRSEFIFKVYLTIHKHQTLKATTYQLNKSMSVGKIVSLLEKGNTYNPDEVRITFKEGKRITDYAKEIEKNTNHSYEEVIAVFKDRNILSQYINDYWFLTDEILNTQIYYPLEGYLAPDTYHFKNKDVEVEDIIVTMLEQMKKNLEKYRDLIQNNIHYYITMASIVELEGTNLENRKMIVGVFQNRLNARMSLGSDVTAYYGVQQDMNRDLTKEEFNQVNGYNTRVPSMIAKMPVGPICNISLESLEASIHPTLHDYYYFVADKNGKIYYTKTMAEHEKKVVEIKSSGDWIW
ncbi:MAG: endolytic transglycosylase MltG [Bacilli bacterium]|nr:endolytic transglycosylase MltG [Bacilli bacterium]